MSSPKVTILVPICNVERYLGECLESLVNQTLKDIQIICIDDGSTDNSPQIIEKYANRDPRIEVISKPNSGYGDSMNKGLEQARGEYIGIVESDDFASKNMFEDLYNIAKTNNADIVKSNYYFHNSDTLDPDDDEVATPVATSPLHMVVNPLQEQNIFLEAPSIWAAIYRRDLLNQEGIRFLPTPGASFQDTSFNFRAFAAARRVVFTDIPYLHYRIDNVNSSVKSPKKVFCICDEYDAMWNYLETHSEAMEALGKQLPRIQYGGYFWNLDRLTPAVQPAFYERFVKDFARIKEAGLLDESYFDEVSWRRINELIDDPEKFYKKEYGPIKVKRSVVAFFEAHDFEVVAAQAKSILAGLDENDILHPITCQRWVFEPEALKHVREADSRFITSSILINPEFPIIDPDQLRGNQLITLVVNESATAADLGAVAQALSNESFDRWGAPSIHGHGYSMSELKSENVPYDVRLLSAGLAVQQEMSLGTWAETLPDQGFVTAAEYATMRELVNKIIQWAQMQIDESTLESNRVLDKYIITPLWKRLTKVYDELPYNDRAVVSHRLPERKFSYPVANTTHSGPQPDLSVIIPVYNAQQTIKATVQSALSQLRVNIEVICVVDGSPDDSLTILQSMALTDPRIRVYSQVNMGAGGARNTGIKMASGKYCAFIDADDVYPAQDTLAKLYEAAVANEVSVCAGSFAVEPLEPTSDGKPVELSGDAALYVIPCAGMRDFYKDCFDYGWIRCIYKRELFDKPENLFPDLRWYEDPVFFTNVMSKVRKFYAIPDVVYVYREAPDKTLTLPAVRDLLTGISHNLAFAKEKELSVLYSHQITRLDYDYLDSLLEYREDEEVFLKLAQIQGTLDLSLMRQTREMGWNVYCLKALRFVQEEKKTAIERAATKVSKSGAYHALQRIYERVR